MDMHHEEVTNEDSKDLSFIDSMYEAVSAMKGNLPHYLPLFFLSFALKAYGLAYFNAQDDMTVITVAAVNVFGTIIQSVFILNFFFFAFEKLPYRVSKVLWDIPTYMFYGFLTSLLMILGVAFFVIPFFYVAYFYSFVAMTSILFDKEGESNFAITKKKVSTLGGTYLGFLVISFIIAGIAQVVTNYAPGTGIAIELIYIICLLLTLIQDVLTGVLVSLFRKA
ncbi:hypothetical protein ABMA70_03255 [Halobacteriovorax sp. XZX-3]|uniref:hypothetical protein n=1 Tax=unclassified Halobacteriovorax TaxID=2639665 RepID=UPI000CD052C3|nr:hypothetical protein [Halobacteriovorax sp. DA5]POB14749.1 hypothetical protein C0Z22_06535 [Halobacteriovorax sp. DA5]